jgi:hypothetical protein
MKGTSMTMAERCRGAIATRFIVTALAVAARAVAARYEPGVSVKLLFDTHILVVGAHSEKRFRRYGHVYYTHPHIHLRQGH